MSFSSHSSATAVLKMLAIEGKRFLQSRVRPLFELADDTFFGMAERATNDRLQSAYFDAMRLLRVERSNFEGIVVDEFSEAFARLDDPTWLGSETRFGQKVQDGDLKLLENDDLEEIIALDNMASSANDRNRKVLGLIERRLGELAIATVNNKTSPFSPDALAEIFSNALNSLPIELESRLVFLKLVEKTVFNQEYGLFLEAINQMLMEEGILPGLEQERPKIEKSASVAVKPKPAPASHRFSQQQLEPEAALESVPDEKPDENAEVRARIKERARSELLSRLTNPHFTNWNNSARPGARPPLVADLPATSEPESLGPPLELEQILDTLSGLQKSHSGKSAQLSLQEMLDAQLRTTGGSLSTTDKGMVNLIDNLYGNIRVNHYFAPPVQNLFEELKLPLLKMVLKDPSFFDKQNHPARRLMNEMAKSATGFTGSEDDKESPVFQQMVKILENLSDDCFTEKQISGMLMQFMAVIEREKRTSGLLEQRMMEEVAARERINWARTQVEEALAKRLLGRDMPKLFTEFAEKAWSKVLFMAHLREGESSRLWKESLSVFDKLVKLQQSPRSLRKPEAVVSVLEFVRERLEQISFDPYESGRFLGAFEQYFVGEGEQALDSITEQQILELLKSHLVEMLDADIPGTNIQEEIRREEELDTEAISKLNELRKGAWVEFPEPNNRTVRAKLAGVVGPSWRYIFVNQRGNKVAEKHRSKLAVEMLDGNLTILENSHLFDKALKSAVEELKQNNVRSA